MTNVHVECRPNLRACNFFIKSEFNVESTSVDIREAEVEITGSTVGTLIVALPPSVTLVPRSVSGLALSKEAVLFRSQIVTFNSSYSEDKSTFIYKPDFEENETVRLFCSFCCEPLSDSLCFSRLLPLPFTEDLGDFFCHRHSEGRASLDPSSSDFFYNFFHYKIRADNLIIPNTANQLKCPKCFALHGEFHGQNAKLWNSTVCVAQSLLDTDQMGALNRFLNSLRHFVRDLPIQMNKLIVTCAHDTSRTHYTLVWMLDRSLVLLTGSQHSPEQKIQLEIEKVMKILYSHYTNTSTEVDEWLGSFTTFSVPIPPRIEEDFLNYLLKMAEKIPTDSNKVTGMNISYLQI